MKWNYGPVLPAIPPTPGKFPEDPSAPISLDLPVGKKVDQKSGKTGRDLIN